MARCQFLMNQATFHHIVDVDIKGFFDNVNHSKLLSQLYTIGVKDKRVLAIINKMLKAPIFRQGVQGKGTPQGAILSPLLSNVVLNDLDNWIASQWDNFPSKHRYTKNDNKITALKKTANLKEMYIVRYADDFKIFAKNHKAAWKIFHAVKGYVNNHLKLEISNEKSGVTNLRRRRSEFLGFEIKVTKKRKKYVANTHVSKRNKKNIREKVKKHLKRLQKRPTWENIRNYNAHILGIHNYYRIATQVNKDFSQIAYSLLYTQFNRLKKIGKCVIPRSPPESYKRFYKNNFRTFRIGKIYLFPLPDVKVRNPMNFSQSINNYSELGRLELHKKLRTSVLKEIQKLQYSVNSNENLEYADNRLSRYSMQNGQCAVTNLFLIADEVHCHHIKPKKLDGSDEFKNLVVVHKWVHRLIHATDTQTIDKYKRLLKLTGKQIEKLNKYREICSLTSIY